jgi:hypothetical protein
VLVLQWNRHVQRIQEQAYAFYFVFKHPSNEMVCKAGGSVFRRLPVQSCSTHPQLHSSFLYSDLWNDALVLCMGAKLLYRLTPPDVLKQCHKLAKIATISKQEKVGPMPAAVASLVIATLWLFAAIASALMMTYVLHWRNSH